MCQNREKIQKKKWLDVVLEIFLDFDTFFFLSIFPWLKPLKKWLDVVFEIFLDFDAILFFFSSALRKKIKIFQIEFWVHH